MTSVDTFEFVPADEESVNSDEEEDVLDSETTSPSGGRDEKKVIEKMTEGDSFQVQICRAMATNVLVFTCLAVTLVTHKFLADEQQKSFEQAFDQAALTVAEAAVMQQENTREAMSNLAHIAASAALATNQTWPLVTVPLYDLHARDSISHGQVEFLGLWHRVNHSDLEAFTDYTSQHYPEVMEEAHLLSYGNLERLEDNDASTSCYKAFVSRGTPANYSRETELAEYWPGWQLSPPPMTYETINWNIASLPAMGEVIDAMVKLRYETTFTSVLPYDPVAEIIYTNTEHDHSMHDGASTTTTTKEHPRMLGAHPVHQDPTDDDSRIVAAVVGGVALDVVLRDVLPDDTNGIVCILKNNMGQTFSYEINGHEARYLGERDFHDRIYDKMFAHVSLALHTHPNYTSTPGHAQYELYIYPSATFELKYNTGSPELLAAIISVTFILVAGLFFVYDVIVQRRTDNLVSTAAQSNAIVSSIFPEHMMKRMMKENEQNQAGGSGRRRSLKVFLNNENTKTFGMEDASKKPLADLFLDTTVLMGDICGFTAWSSTREPFQVFALLETLYQSFDKIAKKRRVYKVETVGDCYVAVCGLPEARDDHAVVICRFARDMLSKFNILTNELEVTLGPGTGELGLRIGIHSGPVTAGVLRGERARFQLFGDTMNTCSRLESTGRPNRIHASKGTAQLLINAGKEAWLEKLDTPSHLKGKGLFQTFFVNPHGDRALTIMSSFELNMNDPVEALRQDESDFYDDVQGVDDRTNRLINWNVEMLLQLMKQVAASPNNDPASPADSQAGELELRMNPLDEVREIIALPDFDKSSVRRDPEDIRLPHDVVKQLHGLVSKIALMYNDNPFHNFEHASHVVMSVIKLMSRIGEPTHLDDLESDDEAAAAKHDHTYGITSDPLTPFACAFSALIHDVAHAGVSNAQLVKEGVPIAEHYKQRSVAEQNSLDLSWDLLMDGQFEALRTFLFPTQKQLLRFRQLVVNSVMSTDIVDKEMKELRNARWAKAFAKDSNDANTAKVEADPRDAVNRKATIVIEHIIQASDISHTMQHWKIYRKWNQKLYEELYVAYLNGRMEKDPAEFWYNGEFGFFDFYIIPLTQKLKECGVFGVSSGEYLEYARQNREEWEEKGEAVVAGMIEECHKKYGVKEQKPSLPKAA